MTDYLAKYGHKKSTPMFQVGGAMPAEGGAPAPAAPAEGGEDQLKAALMQIVQTQDKDMALEFCMMLAEQMGLGAPAPAEGAGTPMARRGMRFSPRFKADGTK